MSERGDRRARWGEALDQRAARINAAYDERPERRERLLPASAASMVLAAVVFIGVVVAVPILGSRDASGWAYAVVAASAVVVLTVGGRLVRGWWWRG